jgi:hypothetical protein
LVQLQLVHPAKANRRVVKTFVLARCGPAGCRRDWLLAHKQALFSHLVERWRDLFDVLFYDLTSTYFESDPSTARRGAC